MKGLIIAREEPAKWIKSYFRGIDPYLLKIANKPLLEYFVDLMQIIGIEEIRFVYDYSSCEINDYFGDGTKWGLNFSYSLFKPEDSLEKIYLKNKSFAKDCKLLIVEGYNFLQYNKNNASQDCVCQLNGRTHLGNVRLVEEKDYKEVFHCEIQENNPKLVPIDSIKAYFDLSMMVIDEGADNYVLPGYSSEEKAYIGADSSYPRTVAPDKPIMMGNHVRIHDMVIIGPDVIVGNNSIIDSMTTIKNSIIYDNTYIGQELDIINKIVYKNTLISAETGESISMNENFLLSGVERKYLVSSLQLMIQYLLASILFIVQVIPFILFSPMLLLWIKKYSMKKYHLMDKAFNTKRLLSFKMENKPFLMKVFLWLSLDKFILLPRFFKGDILLMGNTIMQDRKEYRYIVRDLPFYKPGIFSYSESLGRDIPEEIEIHERVYSSEPTFFRDQTIFFVTLFKRLVGTI